MIDGVNNSFFVLKDMKNKFAVGIDIGTTKVTVVIGQQGVEDEIPQIIGVGIASNSGMRKGVVIDVEETVAVLTKAVGDAERMAGVNIDHAYLNVNGGHISSANNKGVIAISNQSEGIVEEDVNRVIETAQAMSLPVNREVLHVVPRDFAVDGEGGIKNPIGMNGSRLEVDAHIIMGATPFIKNLVKCLSQVGIGVSNTIFSPLAAAKSCLDKKQKELGVVLIDIGGGTTSLVVFEEGDVYHTAVFPVGAGHITSDMAIGLRTSLEVAERVKLDYGSALPLSLNDRDKVDLSKIDRSETELVSRKYIAEIIEARLNEIFGMVSAELRKIGRDGLLPAGAVLTGGGAKLPGIVEAAKDSLQMAASLGFPHQFSGMVDKLDSPQYTVATGLMLWGLEDESSPGAFFDEKANPRDIIKKIISWFGH